MTATLTVLIIGGYGAFGGRLVELLEDEPRLTLIVAGRSLERATRYCKSRSHARATLVPAILDRTGDLIGQLERSRPDIVVDASGPFQGYGDDRYRVIQACLVCGINYLDLADGSDFVAGVVALDAAAKRSRVYALSGVSSFPVLTAAVVRRLSSDLAAIHDIRGGIAPSPYAGVGINVVRAIAGYAGQRCTLQRNGETARGYPFTEQMLFTIAPPGLLPLKATLFSLVDVPDLRALAQLWPQARTIWMGAGPVPEILHRALIALAWPVRLRLLPSLAALARLMHFVSNRLVWGEHRGGMFVEVEGEDAAGRRLTRSWHLLAEGDDGPLIPSMAIEAIIRKALDGRVPPPGARACLNDVELDDYERLFARRTISTGLRESTEERAPLYAQLLGSAWDELPPAIRRMHAGTGSAEGRASVERGGGMLARWAAVWVGLPNATPDTPVRVAFEISQGGETWTRFFGSASFASRQFAGSGRSHRLLCERFGPLTFAMALVVEDQRLRLVMRRWSVLGIPLPLWLCPRSDSYETIKDGVFRFHVDISHPLTGLIVRYRGWLEPTS